MPIETGRPPVCRLPGAWRRLRGSPDSRCGIFEEDSRGLSLATTSTVPDSSVTCKHSRATTARRATPAVLRVPASKCLLCACLCVELTLPWSTHPRQLDALVPHGKKGYAHLPGRNAAAMLCRHRGARRDRAGGTLHSAEQREGVRRHHRGRLVSRRRTACGGRVVCQGATDPRSSPGNPSVE